MSRATAPRMGLMRRALCRFLGDEAGTATIEFVIAVPVLMLIFMTSMESGLYQIRATTMERALDLVMRDFRLGKLGSVEHDEIRDIICDSSTMLNNCHTNLRVWIEPVDTTSWGRPGGLAHCGDGGDGSLVPPNTGIIAEGGANEIMMVRVCMLVRPMFPSTSFSLRLRADQASGSYQLATATFVVNEPRSLGDL